MRVVTNTSPLLNLAAIGHGALLAQVFGQVRAPEAVRQEMDDLRRRDARFAAAAPPGNSVRFERVNNQPLAASLALHLDAGEAEAIALAVETQADLLLVDERLATRTAQRLGIKTLGLLGVLLLAKRRGHLPQVAPLLNRLEAETGFWVGASLRAQVLRSAGEAP